MKQFFLLLLIATTMLLSCDKSFEKFDPNNNGYADTVWATNQISTLSTNDLYNNLKLEPLIDSVSALNGGTIYFSNNISIVIPASTFLLDGKILKDGKVTIKFLLITKQGDMVRMCLPTQSNGYLLESGGEIFLDASQYGKILTMQLGPRIIINYRSAGQPNPLMKGFIGALPTNVTGANSCFNWVPVQDSSVKIITTPNGYQIFTGNLSWINCDAFSDTTYTKTNIAITLPINFTNANTNTFIVYKTINGLMQFDADANNKIWVKNKVPINKAVIFISVSKRGGDYYLGKLETYTTTNQHIVLKPEKQKLQDIINYLGSL